MRGNKAREDPSGNRDWKREEKGVRGGTRTGNKNRTWGKGSECSRDE